METWMKILLFGAIFIRQGNPGSITPVALNGAGHNALFEYFRDRSMIRLRGGCHDHPEEKNMKSNLQQAGHARRNLSFYELEKKCQQLHLLLRISDGTAFAQFSEFSLGKIEILRPEHIKARWPQKSNLLWEIAKEIPRDARVWIPKFRTEADLKCFNKAKNNINNDIFGNPIDSDDNSFDVINLVPHSIKSLLISFYFFLSIVGGGLNDDVVDVTAKMFFGYQHRESVVRSPIMYKAWTYMGLMDQHRFFFDKCTVMIIPVMGWRQQLAWNGVQGYSALVVSYDANTYRRIGACNGKFESEHLHTSREEDRAKVQQALWGMAEGFQFTISLLCHPEILPPVPSHPDKEMNPFQSFVDAVNQDGSIDILDPNSIPSGVIIRSVTFRDGSAPHPALLTFRSINPLFKMTQAKCLDSGWQYREGVKRLFPTCRDLEEGGTCALCRREMVARGELAEFDKPDEWVLDQSSDPEMPGDAWGRGRVDLDSSVEPF